MIEAACTFVESPFQTNEAAQVGPRDILGYQEVDLAVLARRRRLARDGGDRVALAFVSRRVKLAIAAGLDLSCEQYLDGDVAPHHLMLGLEDLPHSPLAQPVGNHIRPQRELGASRLELLGLICRDHLSLDEPVGQRLILERDLLLAQPGARLRLFVPPTPNHLGWRSEQIERNGTASKVDSPEAR